MTGEITYEQLLRKLTKEEIIKQAVTWNTAHTNLMNTNQELRKELEHLYAFIGRMAVNQDWEPKEETTYLR